MPVRQHLVDFLRIELGLTGAHLGCEHGICGACSVRVDGAVVRGCLMLAVQADGAEVVTIEGLTETGEIADLQEAFVDAQRAAVRLLHAGHADDRGRAAGAGGAEEPRGDPRRSSPATTAAAPAITPSSMPSRRRLAKRLRATGKCGAQPVNDKPDTSAFTRPNSYVGRTLSRAGAKRAVAGRGRYTDDFSLPRMLHAAFVRSPFAHARIVVDRHGRGEAPAGRRPGHDGGGAGQALHGAVGRHAHLLSRHEVGAAISAWPSTGRAGRASRWRWSWRARGPRPRTPPSACGSSGRSCRPWRTRRPRSTPGTPPIHAELGDNLAFRKTIDTGNVEAAFAKADLVIEDTFEFGRHTAVSLESRAVLANYDKATGKLTITTSSQCPHMIQRVFARTLGLPDHMVQIIAPDVGGSFGLKIHSYGDELATAAASIRLGRPVKFIADRLESFVSDIHARENFVKARIAVAKSGEILAFDVDVLSGAGAYSQYPRTSVLEGTQVLNVTGGPYRHKNYRGRANVVYLNKPPSSQYRAVGHPIGNTVGEHLVDRAAAALGIDADRDAPPQRHARRRLSRCRRQRHQAQGPVAPALHRRAGRAHALSRVAAGAGAAAREGHPPRHRHRLLHQGHLAGPARLLRHRRRADLAAGCVCHPPRAQWRRAVLGGRDRAGPGYRHGHGARSRPRRWAWQSRAYG